MAGVKLRRLKINKYRNVAPGTELVFNDTFNVLLGQNGTGKTTLLRLIAMVVAHDFASLKDTEFALEYELTYPGVSVRVSIENRQRMGGPGGAIRAIRNIGGPGAAARNLSRVDVPQLRVEALPWAYTVMIQVDGDEDVYTISANPFGARLDFKSKPGVGQPVEVISPFDELLFMYSLGEIIALSDDSEGQRARLIATLENSHVPILLNTGRFDEALGGFHAMSGLSEDTTDRLGRATFNIIRRNGNGFDSSSGSFWPTHLWTYLSGLTADTLTSESIKVAHSEFEFLKKAIDLFEFEGGEMILRLSKKEVVGGGEFLTYSNFSFLFTLDQGSIITQEALSYGQKRLLSFLYYVAANDDIIIADELVNGMHHAWIEACLDAIGDRQSFLTSQNPLLLDFLPFTSAEEVQRSFIQCDREKREDQRTQLVWANMTAENAESFYRAYEAGVQHVSEILRTKGLW